MVSLRDVYLILLPVSTVFAPICPYIPSLSQPDITCPPAAGWPVRCLLLGVHPSQPPQHHPAGVCAGVHCILVRPPRRSPLNLCLILHDGCSVVQRRPLAQRACIALSTTAVTVLTGLVLHVDPLPCPADWSGPAAGRAQQRHLSHRCHPDWTHHPPERGHRPVTLVTLLHHDQPAGNPKKVSLLP
jgi:hypothetical protein